MKKKKVLMLAYSYPSVHDPSSGVFFREQARAIGIFNDIVVICCYSFPIKSQTIFNIIKNYRCIDIIEEGIRTVRVEYPWVSNKIDAAISFIFPLFAIFRIRNQFKFDIFHAQNFFPAGLVGLLFCSFYKTKLVITEHSGNFDHTNRNFIRRIFIKLAMNYAARVIAVSRHLSSSIKKYNPKLAIDVIPNPVDTHKFSFVTKKISCKNQKKILHISSLNHNKGIDYLVVAAQKLKQKRSDFVINIIGGEDVNLIIKYQNIVNSLNLNYTIKILGRKSHDIIPDYLRNCDFFVLPSLRESFGVVLIEAMACGKPLVVTDCGGPSEIINEKIGIIVAPGNVEELTAAIDFMLDNFPKYDPVYISQHARDKFNYKEVGTAISRVYRNIV